MSSIGPGDFVECVDARPCPIYGPVPLVVGGLYVVSRVEQDTATVFGWSIFLVGVRSGGPHGGFGGGRFRPIYRPKQSLIESLKTPVEEPA